MTQPLVQYEVHDHVASITINRPEVLNAINTALLTALYGAMLAAEQDAAVRVVVLRAAGRAFSSGADITAPVAEDYLPQFQIEDEYLPCLHAIRQSPKPYICAINGVSAGAATGLALACDLVVMADDAHLLLAFTSIGLVPDVGVSWQLLRAIGRRGAFEAIAFGDRLPAARCLELGLCNRVVPASELFERTQQWAKALAARAPLAVSHSKKLLDTVDELSLVEAVYREAALQNRLLRSIDAQEAINAFRERRVPRFQGR